MKLRSGHTSRVSACREWSVLVPVFGDRNDANAKSILSEHFPDREVIGILARAMTELGGMIHCVTQQQPAVAA